MPRLPIGILLALSGRNATHRPSYSPETESEADDDRHPVVLLAGSGPDVTLVSWT